MCRVPRGADPRRASLVARGRHHRTTPYADPFSRAQAGHSSRALKLWDYDVPAQPTLVTVRRGGREIPAVAQATKRAPLFVLQREPGEPLFGVEERPVPPTDVPGEESWPTQPFPLRPPPLVPQSLRPEDARGLPFWDRGRCRERIASLRYDGVFTPPSLRGTIIYPGNAGGTNSGSVAFYPLRGLLLVNTSRVAH